MERPANLKNRLHMFHLGNKRRLSRYFERCMNFALRRRFAVCSMIESSAISPSLQTFRFKRNVYTCFFSMMFESPSFLSFF